MDSRPDLPPLLPQGAGDQSQPVAATQQHFTFQCWKVADNNLSRASFLKELQSRGEMAALIAAKQQTPVRAIHHGELPPAA